MKNKIKNALKMKFLGEYSATGNKEKSLIILVVGFIILFTLLIAIRISFNNNYQKYLDSQNNEVEYLKIDELFNKYISNYKYNISINDNDLLTIYNGEVISNIDDGKRLNNEDLLEYHIENNIITNKDNNEVVDNLYYDYLSYFFTPSNVYNYIKDLKTNEENIDNKKIYNYNSIYNESNIIFKITTTKDSIEEINYTYNDVVYSIKLN